MKTIIKTVFILPEPYIKGLEKGKIYLFIPKIIKNEK